jgi:putative FmdB family regulatory protein
LPLYEYQCAACGEPVEIRHGFRETVEQPCAKCGGELKRVFTPAGIVFKGSGFYVNDSRTKNPGSASSASASSGSSGSSAGASSSESAPSTPAATTTEAKTPPKDGGSPGKSEAAA